MCFDINKTLFNLKLYKISHTFSLTSLGHSLSDIRYRFKATPKHLALARLKIKLREFLVAIETVWRNNVTVEAFQNIDINV